MITPVANYQLVLISLFDQQDTLKSNKWVHITAI